MSSTRTNGEWVHALQSQAGLQEQALADLRQLLLKASLYTLVHHLADLHDLDQNQRLVLAEDCAQDALLAVLQHLPEFRGDSKFTTWAFKFGVNITLTRAKKEHWKNISLEQTVSAGEDDLGWLFPDLPATSGQDERWALQNEVCDLIRSVVRTSLSPRQRQVLKWMVFDGVPMDVVVERLETNRNAIYKLLHDARLKVKNGLAQHGYRVEEIYDLFAS